eukprot:m.94585 g.94585  ORF g.94585 m.94585 type:complete len:160 (+) comp16551_c0_seq2:148-627(+)
MGDIAELASASLRGDISAVTGLIEKIGAGPDVLDQFENTALHTAAIEGHAELCRHLVSELGAQVDLAEEDGKTALCMAANAGQADVVKVLLSLGANKEHTPHGGKFQGMTPLDIATKKRKTECVEILKSFDQHGPASSSPSPTQTASVLSKTASSSSMC